MNPNSDIQELRVWVEQEVNSIAAGFDRTELPENLGILIPSIDLQKIITRITAKIQSELIEARYDELVKLELGMVWTDRLGVKKYLKKRLSELTTQKSKVDDV